MKEIDITINIKDRNNIYGISGRKNGQAQRRALKIDTLEKENNHLKIVIPKSFLSISSSFFLGLFGKSVRKCGSKKRFYEKFIFEVPEDIKLSIDESVDDALREGTALDDLD